MSVNAVANTVTSSPATHTQTHIKPRSEVETQRDALAASREIAQRPTYLNITV